MQTEPQEKQIPATSNYREHCLQAAWSLTSATQRVLSAAQLPWMDREWIEMAHECIRSAIDDLCEAEKVICEAGGKPNPNQHTDEAQ